MKDLSHGRQGRGPGICFWTQKRYFRAKTCISWAERLLTHSSKVRENGCHCTRAACTQVTSQCLRGCLVAYAGSGNIMVGVVSEHSSFTMMGMLSTAFRHLALTTFCMPCGQLGAFFFFFLLHSPISLLNNFTSSHTNSSKYSSSARRLLLPRLGRELTSNVWKRKWMFEALIISCWII